MPNQETSGKQQFQLGQRWVSDTEPELGLGVIIDDGAEGGLNRITVNFPAAKERRTYAIDNAPINRVQFGVGDEIKSAQGAIIRVQQVVEEMGYIVYSGTDRDGNEVVLPELDLNSYVRFSRPQDRLLSGQIDKLDRYELRFTTLQHRDNLFRSHVRGLIGPRIQLLPHQLYIANEVANRYAPRVLLADEVGLGKTIEAGLIIHSQLCTGHASRVIVVVPESLIHQWLVEMLRRFNLQFSVFDHERCEALAESNDNPFESGQLILLSSEFLCAEPQRLQQACDAGWDLLIIDEAHHLVWEQEQQTPAGAAYRCIEQLAQHSNGLLLLTATPEQLGVESHFARLRLLDPDRYYDFEQYRQEESGYRECNELVNLLLSAELNSKLKDDKVVDNLRVYLSDKVDALISARGDLDGQQQLIDECVSDLLDVHGTGRVLFRNTRNAISGFPSRVLHAHPLTATAHYLSPEQTLDVQLHPEFGQADNWCEQDTRVAWVLQWLKDNRQEKAVLICRELSTCQALEDFLRYKKGMQCVAFHQGLTLIERDRAAAFFADDIDGAQLLICSEIGSEGRNFQFAHHLILFDLPLNPDLLEQRIGRLARIGQQQDVNIHVPHFSESPQAKLLQWFQSGLNAIELPCPAAHTIYEQYRDQLQQQLLQHNEDAWQQFLINTKDTTKQLMLQLEEGRNRLLELNSCRPTIAADIIKYIETQENEAELHRYMTTVFDAYGVDEDFHSEHCIIVHPGDHMKQESFPGLSDDGLTATFDRDTALSREDMNFLTWEHPMVTQVMDMILHGESGNTAVGTLKLPPLKPGTLLIETIFVVHCASPKALQLDRYFSESMLRLVLDEKNDLSKVLSQQRLSTLLKPTPDKRTAQEIVKQAKPSINKLLARAQNIADQTQTQLIAKALSAMQHHLEHELARLTALAKINPNIRPSEIEHLQTQISDATEAINTAELSLDMIRIIVCV